MPKLIKNNAVIDDSWQLSEDGTATNGNSFIALSQWLEAGSLPENIAPYIGSGEDISAALPALLNEPLIAIHFPTFMDGRGFSTAEILRREGFKGELRAIGHLIQDQLYFLKRCGFNSMTLREGTHLEGALASFNDFSENYQTSADTAQPLFRRR